MDSLDQNLNLKSGSVEVTDSVKQHFLAAAKWTRFLAIISFIFGGILGIFSLIALIGALVTGVGILILGAFLYVGFTVVMIFFGIYLIKYSMSIEKGLNSNNQSEFELGIENLKSFFKLAGIYTIVFIGLYIILMIIGFGSFATMGRF